MNRADILKARANATTWARFLLARDPDSWVILDTETTGLGPQAEVVQIGVINGRGDVLMDNVLVKPKCQIEPDATRIHHITKSMVENAPSFLDVLPQLRDVVRDKLLVIYNAEYDLRLLIQSAKAHGSMPYLPHGGYDCAMLRYAEWVGKWNDYHGSFRWQKLAGGDHSALGDCIATLAVIEKMAGG